MAILRPTRELPENCMSIYGLSVADALKHLDHASYLGKNEISRASKVRSWLDINVCNVNDVRNHYKLMTEDQRRGLGRMADLVNGNLNQGPVKYLNYRFAKNTMVKMLIPAQVGSHTLQEVALSNVRMRHQSFYGYASGNPTYKDRVFCERSCREAGIESINNIKNLVDFETQDHYFITVSAHEGRLKALSYDESTSFAAREAQLESVWDDVDAIRESLHTRIVREDIAPGRKTPVTGCIMSYELAISGFDLENRQVYVNPHAHAIVSVPKGTKLERHHIIEAKLDNGRCHIKDELLVDMAWVGSKIIYMTKALDIGTPYASNWTVENSRDLNLAMQYIPEVLHRAYKPKNIFRFGSLRAPKGSAKSKTKTSREELASYQALLDAAENTTEPPADMNTVTAQVQAITKVQPVAGTAVRELTEIVSTFLEHAQLCTLQDAMLNIGHRLHEKLEQAKTADDVINAVSAFAVAKCPACLPYSTVYGVNGDFANKLDFTISLAEEQDEDYKSKFGYKNWCAFMKKDLAPVLEVKDARFWTNPRVTNALKYLYGGTVGVGGGESFAEDDDSIEAWEWRFHQLSAEQVVDLYKINSDPFKAYLSQNRKGYRPGRGGKGKKAA